MEGQIPDIEHQFFDWKGKVNIHLLFKNQVSEGDILMSYEIPLA